MSMDEQEIEQLYIGLMSFLRNSQYSQIARDVEEQVEEGYIKKEKVKVDLTQFKEDDLGLEQERRNTTSTRTLYRRSEYSIKEKLQILITAIETSLINPILIRNHVVQFFRREAERNTEIDSPDVTLYPSVDENIEPLTGDSTQTQREIENLGTLIEAVNNIRKALENGISE